MKRKPCVADALLEEIVEKRLRRNPDALASNPLLSKIVKRLNKPLKNSHLEIHKLPERCRMELPDDIWVDILKEGSLDDLFMWSQSCKILNRIILSAKFTLIWKKISFRGLPFAVIHFRMDNELPTTSGSWRDYCFKYLKEHCYLKCRKDFGYFHNNMKELIKENAVSLDDTEAFTLIEMN